MITQAGPLIKTSARHQVIYIRGTRRLKIKAVNFQQDTCDLHSRSCERISQTFVYTFLFFYVCLFFLYPQHVILRDCNLDCLLDSSTQIRSLELRVYGTPKLTQRWNNNRRLYPSIHYLPFISLQVQGRSTPWTVCRFTTVAHIETTTSHIHTYGQLSVSDQHNPLMRVSFKLRTDKPTYSLVGGQFPLPVYVVKTFIDV